MTDQTIVRADEWRVVFVHNGQQQVFTESEVFGLQRVAGIDDDAVRPILAEFAEGRTGISLTNKHQITRVVETRTMLVSPVASWG